MTEIAHFLEEETLDFLSQCGILYENTKNPLYVWRGIRMIKILNMSRSRQNPKTIEIPDWCLQYLYIVATRVDDLANLRDDRDAPAPYGTLQGAAIDEWRGRERKLMADWEKAIKRVPDALGLSRRGWNAFAAAHAMEINDQEAFTLEAFRSLAKDPGGKPISEDCAIQMILDDHEHYSDRESTKMPVTDARSVRRRIAKSRRAHRTDQT